MELPLNHEAIFIGQGWKVEHLRLGPTRWTAATKPFDTACGERTAIVYFDGKKYTADYQSEGRNVLEAHFMLDAASGDLLGYLSQLYTYVDQSYARRLRLAKIA